MKYGFLIDNRKCIGCHACTVACKQEHDVPLGRFRTWVKYIEKGEFPNTRRHFSVMRCNHCERPPCVEICPVTALFKRDNGIVDFDPEVCIGCKSCMQACPYDALFIEPESGSAQKCNFCAHRIEANREPPCVTVCPEQAIVMGDLDDPESFISRLIKDEPTTVRAPEKATRPQLRYIEGDPASLVPLAAPPQSEYMWSQNSHPPMPLQPAETLGRRTYDIGHEQQPWGWRVTTYLVTKGLASGCFLIPALQWLLLRDHRDPALLATGTGMAIFFLLVTTGLLIWDLKRPKKFLNILLRPQWKSWLVIGSFVLIAYGGILGGVLALQWWMWRSAFFLPAVLLEGLVALGIPLAAMAAMYTGWLFAQCEARDLWHSPQLPWHLLNQAVLVSSAALLLVGGPEAYRAVLWLSLAFDVTWFFPHELGHLKTPAGREAAALITRGPFSKGFYAGVVACGHLLPMLVLGFTTWTVLPGLLAIGGLALYEHYFIKAGQAIPLS